MRLAEALKSLVYPLQELQDRISLEIPASSIKEENIREALDQKSARYTLVTYQEDHGDEGGKNPDAAAILKRLTKDVLGGYDLQWELRPVKTSRNTQEFIVVVSWPRRKASTRTAAPSYTALPFTVYVDDDVYNLATDGNVFLILKNGEVLIADAPSPVFAVGALCSLAPLALDELHQTQGLPESAPHDFIAGLSTHLLDTPSISDDAKEHFVQFYELATLQAFDARQGTK